MISLQICREEFVALHSEPIMENLSKFLNERFGFEDRFVNIKNSAVTQQVRCR